MRHDTLGRYSFIAADPVAWFESPDGTGALAQLAEHASTLPQHARAELPPFQGGWAGLFGYELGGSLECVPRAKLDEFKVPALAVGLYDVVVAFDHLQQSVCLISQGLPESDPLARRELAKERLSYFRELLAKPSIHAEHNPRNMSTLAAHELGPQFPILGATG